MEFFGFVLSIGLVFALKFLNNTVDDEETLRNKFGIPVLGEIPVYTANESEGLTMFNFLKSKINKAGNIQRPFKSSENQEERTTILGIKNFQVIESYKQLRTNVMFAMSAKDVNVVEFSSSFPGEGKSITSANMAIAMAQTGAKVLLIDCDLRKSVQHKVFKVVIKLVYLQFWVRWQH
mgnify:CR=1 FL=1